VRPHGAPHCLLLAAVVGLVVAGPLFLDTEATPLLILTVLQCLDPAVEDILITAAYVTLYDFNIDLN
jgi:mRNA-decapping enzyme 1B